MRSIYTALFLSAVGFAATAQKVENDDMYFTAKDRAKLQANVVSVTRTPAQAEKKEALTQGSEADVALNPTDSYSARNINPEYSGNPGAKNGSKADYFVEDYTPSGINGNLNGNYSAGTNNPYANYNNNPYAYSPYSAYGSMGWGYPMGGMMSPYGMDPFGYGRYGYSPYGYGSMMSMSYGMRFGYNPWMYSGMGYGGYYSPYSAMYDPFMMSSMYCPYSFYGYNSPLYGGAYYPGTVIVDNQANGRNVVRSRRSDRTAAEEYTTNTRPSVTQSRTGRSLAGGRTRSADDTQAYYERGWRNNSSTSNGTSTTRSYWSNQNQSSGTSTAPSSGRRSDGSSWSSWDNNSSNSGSSWNSGSNSRSSWNGGSSSSMGSSGGNRSSMGGGGGGGGHTRGRD